MAVNVIYPVAFAVCLISCSTPPSQAQYDLEIAFPNLSFSRPVDLQNAGDGTNRLFVVEQEGFIRVFANDSDVTSSSVFLDIHDRVAYGGERGLLGLAFHPDYSSNGYFYVNYTASSPDRTVISRFSVSAEDPDVANPGSEVQVLTFAQPYPNHNGGQVLFGSDRMLYIAVGDGGSGGDPHGHGQNRSTLLGSILRLDVDNPASGAEYGIPGDNPFRGNQEGYREEIFAYGLRNPWRMSFDAETNRIWAADVGQNAFEEIDVIENGKNYGWNVMEAFECYGAESCDKESFEPPVFAYPHSDGNRSVTGGHVYRGARLPELIGDYVYADYLTGRIWVLSETAGGFSTDLLVDAPFDIPTFGVDEQNELYVCGFDGKIYRFVSSVGTGAETVTGLVGITRTAAYPNPFSRQVTYAFELSSPTRVTVSIYDVLGRLVSREIDGLLPPGYHAARWNGSGQSGEKQSAGTYFVRAVGDGQTVTTPVVYRP